MTNYCLHNSQARNAVIIEIANQSIYLLHVSIAKYMNQAVCRGNNSFQWDIKTQSRKNFGGRWD